VNDFNEMMPQKGDVIVVQEAHGYLMGTVKAASVFGIKFEADSVWVRNMGEMTTAMRSGTVTEAQILPSVCVRDHAIRYWWPWPHAVPTR
jgi:hypothetical protein